MWGSNRAVLGKAQSGHATKHLNTIDATANQVIATIPIVIGSMVGMEIKVIGRGAVTGNVAWTDLIEVEAYRDAAGAILNGAPTFTMSRVGLTTAAVDVVATGNNIEVRVTGEASVIDWVCRASIIESVS